MPNLERIALLVAEIQDELGIATPPGSVEVPPGFVAVAPWGPRGRGKVRYYPQPVPYDNIGNGDFSCAGYWDRISKVQNPITLEPCFPRERLGAWQAPNPQPYIPVLTESLTTWPAYTDFVLHPADWMDQAALDAEQAQLDRDVKNGYGWSPR